MKPPEVKKSRLCWIRSYMGVVHVTPGYETYYLSDKGRIISSCPVGVMHGLKPSRLGQYNQWGGVSRFSVVCREEDLNEELGKFIRKFQKHQDKFYAGLHPDASRPLVQVKFDRAANDHPGDDRRRAKAARLLKAKTEGRA